MNDATGHNRIGVDVATLHKHRNLIAQAAAAVKEAQARLNKLRKAARADGIILGVLDRTMKLAEMTRQEQEAEVAHLHAYMEAFRLPVATQMSFSFGPERDPFAEGEYDDGDQIVADAEGAGFRAGIDGTEWEDDNPHDAASPAGQAWLKGYRDGQAAIVSGGGKAAAPKSGSRKKNREPEAA